MFFYALDIVVRSLLTRPTTHHLHTPSCSKHAGLDVSVSVSGVNVNVSYGLVLVFSSASLPQSGPHHLDPTPTTHCTELVTSISTSAVKVNVF